MRVHATWFSGDTDYGIGLICRHENPSNYYFLSVLSKGEYHIARYRKGKLVSLTRGPQPKAAFLATSTRSRRAASAAVR